MQSYLELLKKVLEEGHDRSDRTGVGTRSLFGEQLKIDLGQGYPLLTTKKMHFKSIAYELLWFLRGDTNIKFLKDNGVTIWDEWADQDGEVGKMYGYQWRRWGAIDIVDTQDYYWEDGEISDYIEGYHSQIDQIQNLIESLKNNPYSRRHIVSTWNVGHLPMNGLKPNEQPSQGLMALAPCHVMFQCYCRPITNKTFFLDMHLYQRSADIFLGLPYNIASYALLNQMICMVLGNMTPGKLIISLGDVHLYSNHIDQAELQLSREPYPLPHLRIKDQPIIDLIKYSDLELVDYKSHPRIKAPIAI